MKSITAVNPFGTAGIDPATAPFFWAIKIVEVQHTDRHINPLTNLLAATTVNTRNPKIRIPQTYKKTPDFPPYSTAWQSTLSNNNFDLLLINLSLRSQTPNNTNAQTTNHRFPIFYAVFPSD
jgi:hypothetical protein